MTKAPLVSYIRVSTGRQARSGLGLEAQRKAIADFAALEGFEVVAEFVEAETGRGADALDRRPQLAAALKAAKKARCEVAVAKLDRLSRDVEFIASLMNREVPFVVVALGRKVPAFMLHVFAAMAQEERRLIAQRTREALAAAKAKGKKLGTYSAVLAKKNSAAAAERDAALEPVLRETAQLSTRAAVVEIEKRGLGKISYQTIARARVRLGLGD